MPINWVRSRDSKTSDANLQLIRTAKDQIIEKREDLMAMEVMMQGHFFGMMAHLTSQARQSNGYS